MANERLYQFPTKASPVPADIIFAGDSAAAFDEVNITIAALIGAYPNLLGIGGLTLGANTYIYVNNSSTFTAGTITTFGVSTLAITGAANSILQTNGSSVPSLTQTLPTAVQGNITQLGAQAAALNMNSHLISNVTDPVSAQDVATRNYVDMIAQGITVQGACRVGTTTALTVTYSNGAAGVGATLTNNGAQAALTIDSVALSVNDRVLVKNQASTLQNGIYTVTNIGSGATNWIMTRSTDYNLPAQINPGDLIVLDAGTTQGSSSWLQTATVTTIGTDAITFSQFTTSLPVSLANGGTSAALTASNGGIFYSTATAAAILAGTATAGLALLSGASTAPTWSASPPITRVNTQLITSTGTYTPTTGMVYCLIEVVGGGGGGGGATGAAGQSAAGAGGGGGGYSSKIFDAATIGASKSVTVGAGGTAGAAAAGTGGTGGTTSVGATLIQATGGFGGTGGPSTATANNAVGGLAGVGSIGTLNIGGSAGSLSFVVVGSTFQFFGGNGGSSHLGGGGRGTIAGGAGSVGASYGGGGGGASSFNGDGGFAGGVGGAGAILITEFVSV